MGRRKGHGTDLAPKSAPAPTSPEAEPVTTEAPRPEPAGQRHSRRPRLSVVIATVLALAIVAGAVVASWLMADDGERAGEATGATVTGSATSTLLLIADDEGRAISLALLVDDGAESSSLLVMPPELTMQLPGYGEGVLADATLIERDGALTELALINELGIRIDRSIILIPGQFAASLGDPVRVDLPRPFIIETRDGDLVSAGSGVDVFVPETAETLLITQGLDSPLEWLQRQRAVWEGFTRRVADNPSAAIATTSALGELTDLLGRALVTVLPVDRVGAGETEVYVVSREGALFAEGLSFLVLTSERRPRVELLNATILPGVTRPLADLLIRAGFELIKTDNAQERFRTETLVIAQGIGNQDSALSASQVIGGGSVVLEPTGSGVVDVSIIVGTDIADAER